MSTATLLGRLLSPDPRDPGCGSVRSALHTEAEAVHAGALPRDLDLARHLRDCWPCAQDLTALVAVLRVLRNLGPADPTGPLPSPRRPRPGRRQEEPR